MGSQRVGQDWVTELKAVTNFWEVTFLEGSFVIFFAYCLCFAHSRHLPVSPVELNVKSLSCVWLCNPVDGTPPGSSVLGIFQARILEWVAIPFCRGSFQPRDWTQVSSIAGLFFTVWTTRETPEWEYLLESFPIYSFCRLFYACGQSRRAVGSTAFPATASKRSLQPSDL